MCVCVCVCVCEYVQKKKTLSGLITEANKEGSIDLFFHRLFFP